MTRTEPPPMTMEPPAVTPRRADRRFAAQLIIVIEAALMALFAITYLSNAINERDSTQLIGAAFCVAGTAVLAWGARRIGREGTAVDAGAPRVAPPPARVPWDWTDVLMFVPGTFAAASILTQVAVSLSDLGLNGVDPTVRTGVESFVQAGMYYTGAIINVFVLVGLRRGGTLQDLGWRRFKWWWIPLAIAAAYATLIVADRLQSFSQQLLPNEINQQCITVRHEFGHFIVLGIIVVCAMAPLAEETVFRGFFYGWLRRWSPIVLAVPINGFVFALAHQQLLLILPLFAVGCVLALVYQGSRSLWPGAIVHGLFNLPGIIAIVNVTSC